MAPAMAAASPLARLLWPTHTVTGYRLEEFVASLWSNRAKLAVSRRELPVAAAVAQSSCDTHQHSSIVVPTQTTKPATCRVRHGRGVAIIGQLDIQSTLDTGVACRWVHCGCSVPNAWRRSRVGTTTNKPSCTPPVCCVLWLWQTATQGLG